MTANEMKKQLIVWETVHLSGLKGLGKGYLATSEIVCACQVGRRPGEGSSALPPEEQVQTTAAKKLLPQFPSYHRSESPLTEGEIPNSQVTGWFLLLP